MGKGDISIFTVTGEMFLWYFVFEILMKWWNIKKNIRMILSIDFILRPYQRDLLFFSVSFLKYPWQLFYYFYFSNNKIVFGHLKWKEKHFFTIFSAVHKFFMNTEDMKIKPLIVNSKISEKNKKRQEMNLVRNKQLLKEESVCNFLSFWSFALLSLFNIWPLINLALICNKGNLNFVGRSGTALDVRYTSHGHGETPEDQTPYALAYLGNDSKQMGISDVISMVFGAHNIYYTPVWY